MQKKQAGLAKESEELEKRREAEAAKEAEEKAQAKREIDKKHVGKIRGEAKEALMSTCKLDEKTAKAVVLAIAKSEIANVSINY